MIFPAMGREVVHLVEPHLRGTALGGFTAFQDLAYGATGPVAGLLADRAGYGSVFLIGGAAAGAGLLIALNLLRIGYGGAPPSRLFQGERFSGLPSDQIGTKVDGPNGPTRSNSGSWPPRHGS